MGLKVGLTGEASVKGRGAQGQDNIIDGLVRGLNGWPLAFTSRPMGISGC
jgi:hypothetical protein